MIFDCFNSVKSQQGKVCDLDTFLRLGSNSLVIESAKLLQQPEVSDEERARIKKNLPIITWQASFTDHKRLNKNAVPSGLFMLDIDHTDEKTQEVIERCVGHVSDCSIVYVGKSISGNGVRVIAECYENCNTLAECQQVLAGMLGVDYDGSCKDFARSSFCVPHAYIYYLDQGIFEREAKYILPAEYGQTDIVSQYGESVVRKSETTETPESAEENAVEVQTEYKGLALKDIAVEWLNETGGMPTKGERNQRLYNCAFSMKYICEFNEDALLAALPDCGLPIAERKSIMHSACSGPRNSTGTPKVLNEVIKKMLAELSASELLSSEDDDMLPKIATFADVFTTSEVPDLPPIWSHFYKIAPDDFKLATMLCLLPFLGTLASRLRAKYRGREIHSPSFIVTLEAPQAQGKSFIKIIDEICLGELKEEDANQRAREKEWKEYRKMVKDLGTKLTKKEAQEFMDSKPEVHIRYVAPTMSVTELMRKMEAADGLHLFAMSTEIDTVYKAMKRDFSNFSDILRKAFDNDEIGQDYASDSSWSGIVRLFYNCIYSGTPKAVRRFFPDVEDGLISRVLFVTIPDQTFKPGKVFGNFKLKEEEDLKYHLGRLNAVSVVDGEPQPEHLMKMDFLVKYMQKWVDAQQKYAEAQNDVTRDTFCRRAAVMGFRAGMIAFYLWNEVTTPPMIRKVKNFSVWIANCALRQFLLRFKIEHDTKSTFKYQDIYAQLGDTFTQKDVKAAAFALGSKNNSRDIIYRWKLAGKIEETSDKNVYVKKGGA